mmetsp:Transcript_13644/g.24464  ORF Transcript_13644/g.24464 Transcript_13644/m.24464 type:complete len:81 (+) Transcript_13644:98-340(+)
MADIELKAFLESCELLKASVVEVEDISGGCGKSFRVLIVSDQFESKRLIAKQRLVYEALGDRMNQIHAIEMKCLTPAEYK